MRLYRFVAALFVMSAALAAPAAVRAQQPWTQVGGLTCKVSANVGFIIGGHQPMACTFAPADGSAPQFYDGAINTIGIDVGVTEGSVLGWGVFAPTKGIAPGALAGEYVGASGDLGFGVGAGANVLVGGSARTFALQPLSLQGSIALNVVLGLSSLKLRVKQ